MNLFSGSLQNASEIFQKQIEKLNDEKAIKNFQEKFYSYIIKNSNYSKLNSSLQFKNLSEPTRLLQPEIKNRKLFLYLVH